MAISRAKKAEMVKQLAAELAGSTTAIVGTFQKLTVSQDFALRTVVRGAGGKYRVVKNKLASRAAEGTKVEEALKGLKGVSSVAYSSGDPVALAKALSEWVKDNEQFSFKLAIVDGKVLSAKEIQQLATMPGREELYSKLLYLISAPAQRLATVINATGRDVAVVLGQAVQHEKFAGRAERVWRGAEQVWRGAERVWRGAERVWRGAERVWRGAERVWRGGCFLELFGVFRVRVQSQVSEARPGAPGVFLISAAFVSGCRLGTTETARAAGEAGSWLRRFA